MCTWVIENLVRLTHFHYVCEKGVWKVLFFLWLFLGILRKKLCEKNVLMYVHNDFILNFFMFEGKQFK
jgi:hypothetical protein